MRVFFKGDERLCVGITVAAHPPVPFGERLLVSRRKHVLLDHLDEEVIEEAPELSSAPGTKSCPSGRPW